MNELKYNKFRYLMASNRYENNISIADYNNPNKKGSYFIDENGIFFNENSLQFPKNPLVTTQLRTIKVYTTETYDDVVSHYQNIKSNIHQKTKTK